tara:strand:+ start:383 stop:526 length:144 start_codon:yes stop_codon:yes gene_type:complete
MQRAKLFSGVKAKRCSDLSLYRNYIEHLSPSSLTLQQAQNGENWEAL